MPAPIFKPFHWSRNVWFILKVKLKAEGHLGFKKRNSNSDYKKVLEAQPIITLPATVQQNLHKHFDLVQAC